LDESYTPFHIVIRAGTTFHDLKDIKAVELEEPTGWVHIPLATKRYPKTLFDASFVDY